jgi:hypothetical protein
VSNDRITPDDGVHPRRYISKRTNWPSPFVRLSATRVIEARAVSLLSANIRAILPFSLSLIVASSNLYHHITKVAIKLLLHIYMHIIGTY